MNQIELRMKVNGEDYEISIPPEMTLLSLLRDRLSLDGARGGCGIGMCGACTVLVENRAVSSCLLLAAQAEGLEVTTIEGLAQGERLHPIQQAYIDHFAFQCAFCTPGFILSTVAMLNEDPNPDDEKIRSYLAGNLCRCGSYQNILEAVRSCREKAQW